MGQLCNVIPPMIDNDYSGTEQMIGTWDGKPLYSRVFPFTSVSADSALTVATNVMGGKKVFRMTGMGKQTDGSWISLGGYYGAASYSAMWIERDTEVRIISKIALTEGHVIVEYIDAT